MQTQLLSNIILDENPEANNGIVLLDNYFPIDLLDTKRYSRTMKGGRNVRVETCDDYVYIPMNTCPSNKVGHTKSFHMQLFIKFRYLDGILMTCQRCFYRGI